MYFDFSKEQYMARDAAREFLAEQCPMSRLRQIIETETGFDRALWKGLAELGWTSVLVPEEHGGLGLGFLDVALLIEESGRALVPAPIIETAAMLPVALRVASAEQRARWLPAIASGDSVATVAITGTEGRAVPAEIGLRARRDGAGFVLDGEAPLVAFGGVADLVLAAARDDDGVSLFVIESSDRGVARETIAGLDPTVRLSAVRLDGVRVGADRVIGERGGAWRTIEAVLDAGRTGLALQAVGGAAQALDMAVEYAKVRHQFGKPIGSFQAIKHKCAEMMVALETSRSGAYYAAWAVGAGAPATSVAVAIAKSTMTEAFRHVAGEAIQVHGGIGFTWEHDLHFYFKRSKYLEWALGTPAECREAIAAALER